MRTNLVQTFKESAKRINLTRTAMRVALISLFISLGVGNAWGSSYYAAVTASLADGNTGRGLVYAANANSEGATNTYANSMTATSEDVGSASATTLWIWAKPARGYEFSSWAKGGNGSPSITNASAAATTISVTAKKDGTNTATAKASFTSATAYTLTFKQPQNFGGYTAEYANYTISSNKFTPYAKTITMTSATSDKGETSYATDEVTLTATTRLGAFLGWYIGGSQVSTNTTYKFNPSATCNVEGRWEEVQTNIPMHFKAVEKDDNDNYVGSYTVGGQTVQATDYNTTTGANYYLEVTLTATPAAGYVFTGWYTKEGKIKTYISYDNPFNAYFDHETTVYAAFSYNGYTEDQKAQFKVGSNYYTDLNAANNAAKSGSNKVIVCTRDGYLVPGNYTISNGVTLLIPYSTAETKQTKPARIEIPSPAPLPSAYRTLIMAEGANITCENGGTICVGGQIVSHKGGNATGYPAGALGVIDMANGGHIELLSGATLYAWGFIKGQDRDQGNNTQDVGTITAQSGSTVWEDIPFGDFRGGSQLAAGDECSSSYRWFPFQSYTVQNIEVPLTIKYGASEKVYTVLYIPTMDLGTQETSPTLIANSGALFLMQDDKSGVRKWYDPTTDLVCYELSGTAQLNQLSVTVSVGISVTVNSQDFDLPISGNMHIILTKCNMTLSKPMTMHAGSVIEVKPDANVTIASNLHMFDLDQYDMFASSKYYLPFNNLTSHKYRGTGTTKDYIEDAKLIVDGTLNVTGGLYTTSSGANIMGNGGGKIVFSSTLPSTKNIYFLKGGSSGTDETGSIKYHYDGIFGKGECDIYLTPYAVNAANLCNEDGSYTKSAKNTFWNVNGRWFVNGKQNERTSAGLEHTHDFTYLSDGNTGTDVNTAAVYSNDRTGLEPRMKWFNVTADACANWWVDGSGRLYNWTLFSAWHQFIPTEVTDLYGCSNGKLYKKNSCADWEELGDTDENCLYTLDDEKTALVGTSFIKLEPNIDDAAYHRKGAATEYYISLEGCIWHPATRIDGEKKAYTVEEEQFIWFDNHWLNVTREEPFFYSTDELNVKTYYEYIGSEWVIAEPYVRVTTSDPLQTRLTLTLYEALAAASFYKDATVTILRDIPNASESALYSALNTTCTLDLNDHTIEGSANKLIHINAPGSTFTITDNSEQKRGKISMSGSANTRLYTVYVADGSLVLERGIITGENTMTYNSTSAKSTTATAIYIAAGKTFTMNGGTATAKSTYSAIGVQVGGSTSANATVNINSGSTINAESTEVTTAYGIYATGGTVNVKPGVIINAKAATTTAYGIYAIADNGYYATLNMTGGTVNVEAATKSAVGVFVGRYCITAKTKPNTVTSTYRAVANISGGTFNVKTTAASSTTAYGVQSRGTATISGGTYNVAPKTTTAYGILGQDGTTTISGSTVVNVTATATAYGVVAAGSTPDDKTGCPYNSNVIVNGGTFNVETTSKATAYGVIASVGKRAITSTSSGYYAGNYVSAGTATINGGVFNIKAKTTAAYGVVVSAPVTVSDASGYAAATGTPKATINGGYFKMSGTGDVNGVNALASTTDLKVQGGYYSHEGNLETYAVSPKHVVPLLLTDPNRPDYEYKVAEAYTVAFKSEDGETTLQTGYQEVGKTPVYEGEAQTKPSTSTTSYVFDGWSSSVGGGLVSPLPALTSAGATYYAHFNETTLKYMVTLNAKTNGGNEEAQVLYVEPGAAVGTLPTATKTGYTFSGWYTAASGGTKLETTTTINADATYIAQFTINQHTLTWNLSGGKVKTAGTAAAANATGSPSGSVNYNATITAPVITKTGYTFAGWGVPTTASTMPDNDLSYTAQWNPAINTTYYVKHYQQNIDDDGYTLVDTDNLTGTTDATVTPDRKSYDGFLTPEPQSLTIGAAGTSELAYNYDRVVYTIKWNATANGGTCSAPTTNIRHGKTLGTMPVATPNSAGVVFGGWYTAAEGGTRITETTQILQNYGTLYAHFVPTYTVTWKNYDETTLTTTELPYDAIPSYGSNPTPEREADENYAYAFDGWSATNGGAIVEEPFPAIFGNKTYYAHYSTTPTVARVKVGSTTKYYTTIDAAFDFVNLQTANTELKLLRNATATASLVFTPAAAMTCTLDLNNCTLSGTVTKLIDVNASGTTFTIDDSSTAKGGKISLTKSASSRIYCLYITAGTVNLKHGIIYCKNSSTSTSTTKNNASAVYVAAGQKFIMDDGTVESISRTSSYALFIDKSTTSEVTINGGLIKGHTNSTTTAGGIYNYCTKLTINGGHIIGHAYTSTSYGINQYGKSTINGGIIEATNDTTSSKGTDKAYGIFVQYNSSTYNGAITIPSTSTVQVMAKARTNTAFAVYISSGSSTGNTIAGGTFTAKAKTGKTAIGVYSYGTITISGGTFNVSTATTAAYGIYTRNKTTTVNGNPIFHVTSGSTDAYGAFAYGYVNAKGASKASGTIKVNGGTFNVTSGSTTAYGAYAGLYGLNIVQKGTEVGDTIFGQHYMPGIIEVTDGTFNVKATTTGAYGIFVAGAKSESGAVGTTTRYPQATIKGGKYKAESLSDANATAYAMNTSASASYLKIQGGKYSTKKTGASTNIEGKYTQPTKTSVNYWVLDNADADNPPYLYEVAEAYKITFKNGETTLQNDPIKKNTTPVYSGADPTKPEAGGYTYTFDGWSTTDGGDVVTLPDVTDVATYYAHFNAVSTETGPWLDIVDVDNTAKTLKVNVSGWPANGWPYYINGTAFGQKSSSGLPNYRADDRTLDIPYGELAVGADFSVTVRKLNEEGDILSKHTYVIPQEITNDTEISANQTKSLYVKNGKKLTITANIVAKNIYVDSTATLEIASGKTLTADTLFLRTSISGAAELIMNGSIAPATKVYYTRIIKNKSKYYQFGLPLSCATTLEEIRLSDGADPKYYTSSGWVLRQYNEANRAAKGSGDDDNWQSLAKTTTITGGVGYEMYSGVNYYREFYFPVDLSELVDTVHVDYTSGGAAGPTNAGWNVLVSPLTSTFTNEPEPEDITVSWMEADGFTSQAPTTTIAPAKVFSYQASKAGKLTFEAPTVVAAAPRRRVAAAEEPERIQWMHLDIEDDNGLGDETSIYSHPTRYEETYKTGIDVAKQSFTASRAIIYSSHAYGDMAFAGVADALLEKGVALTIYSPTEQILTISMRDNDWLNRMAYVWLVDTETGIRTNLLNSHYTFQAAAGTTTGRFYIEGRFFAPQTPTDIENGGDGEQAKVRKIIYNDKLYILIGEQWYDATGKKVISK